MVKSIADLNNRAANFAHHCIGSMSLSEVAHLAISGIDHNACVQWEISPEEWQDGILAALGELHKLNN